MKKVSFTKMHGIGNDYVYFTELPCPEEKLPALSRRLSDRHRSIGGDGIILILPSEVADFKMRIFNADGSEARMCGNGSRCVAHLLRSLGLTTAGSITLETLAGIKTLTFEADGNITVDMGVGHVFAPAQLQGMEVIPVDMGNPHGVVFLDCDPDDFDVHGAGAALERDAFWTNRANIEFVEVNDCHMIKMRVWERGSGETLACGTGACAAALAAISAGRCQSPVAVMLPGGVLSIRVAEDNRVFMTGPAEISFSGEIEI